METSGTVRCPSVGSMRWARRRLELGLDVLGHPLLGQHRDGDGASLPGHRTGTLGQFRIVPGLEIGQDLTGPGPGIRHLHRAMPDGATRPLADEKDPLAGSGQPISEGRELGVEHVQIAISGCEGIDKGFG